MMDIRKILDDLLRDLEQASENEDWDQVDDLCDEFAAVVMENKAQFIKYFNSLQRAEYEKIIDIFMALDPYDWHDFLITQLEKYLKEAEEYDSDDPILLDILGTLTNFSDTVEEEELLSRSVQQELAKHLEHSNEHFRNLCFDLLVNASSHKSDIAMNKLERLIRHEDWRIALKAYQTKNRILGWRKNRKVPFMLLLRSLFSKMS